MFKANHCRVPPRAKSALYKVVRTRAGRKSVPIRFIDDFQPIMWRIGIPDWSATRKITPHTHLSPWPKDPVSLAWCRSWPTASEPIWRRTPRLFCCDAGVDDPLFGCGASASGFFIADDFLQLFHQVRFCSADKGGIGRRERRLFTPPRHRLASELSRAESLLKYWASPGILLRA